MKRDVAKADYSRAFIRAAKEEMAPHVFDRIHAKARNRAGGSASGMSKRAAKDEAKAKLMQRRREAKLALSAIDAELQKAGPTRSQVHVPVPIAIKPKRGKKQARKSAGRVPVFMDDANLAAMALSLHPMTYGPAAAAQMLLAKAAASKAEFEAGELAAAAVTKSYDPTLDDDLFVMPMADSPDRDANRLVSGMDFEMRGGAKDVREAWTRASMAMRRDFNRYDNSFMLDPSVSRLDGLDLDLGSGMARARGYLGMDVYPYDFGTIIRDLGMGIGMGQGVARSIRLVNSLDSLADYRDDPLPLLLDIQATLQQGGRLFYEGKGDLTAMCDWDKLPGLVLVDQDDAGSTYVTASADSDDGRPTDLTIQTFERVPVVRPQIYGADPSVLGVAEEHPWDLGVAMSALSDCPSPEVAMANLIQKSVQHVPQKRVLKFQKHKQLVTSVVYSPDEMDTDGEYMTADDIEQAAHAYLKDARKVGSEHDAAGIGAHVVESWITPVDIELDGQNGPQAVTAGSWLMTVRIDDAAEWQKVLDGEYTGFSLGGHADLHVDA